MTEAERSLRTADKRLRCAEAMKNCNPVTLDHVARQLGVTTGYNRSEDAGEPWTGAPQNLPSPREAAA